MRAAGVGRESALTDRLRLPVLRVLALALSVLAVLGVVDRVRSDDPDGVDTSAAAASVVDASGSGGTSAGASGAGAATGDGGAEAGSADPAAFDGPLVVDRLSSPAPNTARAVGRLAEIKALTVDVTADGRPLGSVELAPDVDGTFTVEITGLQPGPQSVCFDEICGRVLVADPETEPQEAIETRIAAAIERAGTIFDYATYLPGWSIEATGPNSSIGGYTVADRRAIFISTNSGRSDDDLLITVLHELGHAVDVTYFTDELRQQYRELRGLAGDLPWGVTDDVEVGDERWRNAAEDFAEVFVAWALDGDYRIQTTAVAAQPSAAELAEFCAMLPIDGLSCD